MVASCELREKARGARREARGARGRSLRSSRLAALYSQLAPRASQLATRSGISLLEVLISMFVLLFGLLGVAAIFPVGNHYAGRSEQFDRGSALADAAFADLKARGMLQPQYWLYADGTPLMNATGQFQLQAPGYAFALDPLGAAEAGGNTFFPYNASGGANPWQSGSPPLVGATWPIRRVTFAAPAGGVMPKQIAEVMFRLHDDVSVEMPDKNDIPSMQRWITDNNNSPNNKLDDVFLARDYVGSYSWLATVLPQGNDALAGMQPWHARHGGFLYEVSVAIFYKREGIPDPQTERLLPAELGPGGELLIYSTDGNSAAAVQAVDQATDKIRPGHWIALAGVHPTTGKFLLKWYRLLSIDAETSTVGGPYAAQRRAMIDGPAWPASTNAGTAQNLGAILLPGVIGVTTQTLALSQQ